MSQAGDVDVPRQPGAPLEADGSGPGHRFQGQREVAHNHILAVFVSRRTCRGDTLPRQHVRPVSCKSALAVPLLIQGVVSKRPPTWGPVCLGLDTWGRVCLGLVWSVCLRLVWSIDVVNDSFSPHFLPPSSRLPA